MAVAEAEPRGGRAAQVGGYYQHLPLLQDEGEDMVSAHTVAQHGACRVLVEAVSKGGHAAHIHDPTVVPNNQPIARSGILRDVEASAIGRGTDAECAAEDRLIRRDGAAE